MWTRVFWCCLHVVSMFQDPDALGAVEHMFPVSLLWQNPTSSMSPMELAIQEHSGQWAGALGQWDMVLADEKSIVSASLRHPELAESGLMQSLRKLGCTTLLADLADLRAHPETGVVLPHLAENVFEASWRNRQWDAAPPCSSNIQPGVHEALFQACKALHNADQTESRKHAAAALTGYLATFESQVLFERPESLLAQMSTLKVMSDLEKAVTLLNRDTLSAGDAAARVEWLFHLWTKEHAPLVQSRTGRNLLKDFYRALEPVPVFHSSLLHALSSPMCKPVSSRLKELATELGLSASVIDSETAILFQAGAARRYVSVHV
jgi:hypothetical protein